MTRRISRQAKALITAPFWLMCAAICWTAPTSIPPVPDALWTPELSTALQHFDQGAAWPVAERKAYSNLVSGMHSQWLLAPAQVQMQGFDNAERSAITALLAQEFAASGVIVPNTFLVERALGDGRRADGLDSIDALAQKLGATNVIVPFVGHDGAGHLALTLVVYRKPTLQTPIYSLQPKWFTWNGIKFSDDSAPVEAVAGLRGEILQSLGFSPGRIEDSPATPKPFVIPSSPEKLDRDAGPLNNAAALAVLAVTAPPDSRSAMRLYERTLLAALRARDTPEQRFLKAYALFRLGLRPNALTVLQKGASSPGLSALTALVNGNLKGAAALLQHTSGYQRFILEFEFHDLAWIYGHDANTPPAAVLTTLSLKSDWWQILISARWNFGRPEAEWDNVPLKKLLDRHYPLAGQSLKDVVDAHGFTPGQELTEADVQMSVLQHIRGLLIHDQSSLCCLDSSGQIGPLELLSIIEAWSQRRVMRSIELDLYTQGLPEQALARMVALDSVYAGSADFEVLRAETENALALKSPEATRPTHLDQVRTHAIGALLEAGGQTPEGLAALELMFQNPVAANIAADYYRDLPFNPDWTSHNPLRRDTQADSMAELRRALANTEANAGYLDTMLTIGGEGMKSEVATVLRDRFLGSPVADNIRDKLRAGEAAGSDAILQVLRERMRADPEIWDHRLQLGSYLIRHGDYPQALNVFVSYAGFKVQSASAPIELSNEAQEAGHLFFWHGALPQARKMFSIATRYQTGSEAEMISAMEIALMDGNLTDALSQAYQRAARYPSGSAYSNYLSLLHITGHSEQAWKSFNLLASQPLGPGLWESAMVGLRIRATTSAQLDQWLSQASSSQAQSHRLPWPAFFLLNWSVTDREAGTDLVGQMRKLAQEPRGIIEDRDGRLASYPGNDAGQRMIVIRSAFRTDQRPLLKGQSAVDSELVPFSAGILALQHADFVHAIAQFDQVAAHFPIEHYMQQLDAAYTLPDFAYASAMGGDPLKLEPFVAHLHDQIFETYLAQAYFQALRDHDDAAALQSLKQAFGMIEHVVGRTPSMEYQYAEAAERIYRATGKTPFRDVAVSWAHMFQTLQPWHAWAYAMEAELTDNSARREAALQKALFLDPVSPRLRAIPAAQLQQARTSLRTHSPFQLPSQPHARSAGSKSARNSRPEIGLPASG